MSDLEERLTPATLMKIARYEIATQGSVPEDTSIALIDRIETLEAALERLANATTKLPVDMLIDDNSGALLGYAMQCQDEWDEVCEAEQQARQAVKGGE